MAISENVRSTTRRCTEDFTGQGAPLMDFFIERYRDGLRRRDLAPSSMRSRPDAAPIGFEDGRLALVLAEAAMKSVAEGRAVNINEIG